MDIEFHSKVESDSQDDWFGVNIASSDEVVVVGAPSPKHGNGSATVNHEGKSVVLHPPQGEGIGLGVGSNDNYIAVSGQKPSCVYIYTVAPPYVLKATLPFDSRFNVHNIAISDDNTIALIGGHHLITSASVHMAVYHFDTTDTWHLSYSETFESDYQTGTPVPTVSISGSLIVVGVPGAAKCNREVPRSQQGCVHSYFRHGSKWERVISMSGGEHFKWFGGSLMTDGKRLVVSARTLDEKRSHIFMYRYVTGEVVWKDGDVVVPGTFSPTPLPYSGSVGVWGDFVVAAVSDHKEYPDVCGILYKRTGGLVDGKWKQHGVLKTQQQPLSGGMQFNWKISLSKQKVFTSRFVLNGVGKVFVHDVSQV